MRFYIRLSITTLLFIAFMHPNLFAGDHTCEHRPLFAKEMSENNSPFYYRSWSPELDAEQRGKFLKELLTTETQTTQITVDDFLVLS